MLFKYLSEQWTSEKTRKCFIKELHTFKCKICFENKPWFSSYCLCLQIDPDGEAIQTALQVVPNIKLLAD